MSNNLQKIERRAADELGPVDGAPDEYVGPFHQAHPFLSFTYSYKEISTLGGKTYVKSKQTRFEDGRLKSEAFEGTLDGTAYGDMVGQAQALFMSQMAHFLKQFSLFLPFGKK